MVKQKNETSEGIEYNCSVFFSYNKLKKKTEYCIRLETTKIFSTLCYKLDLKAEKKKQTIDLIIKGLSPDQTYLSETKPAIGDIFFDELYGDYVIRVIKPDGSINSAVYNLNIFNQEIKLINETTPDNDIRKFCSFHTAEDLNTFS